MEAALSFPVTARYKMRLAGGIAVRVRRETLPQIDFNAPFCEALFEKRLPTQILKEAVFEGWKIEVHTARAETMERFPSAFGFDFLQPVDFCTTSSNSKYAFMTPRYFKVRRGSKLLLAVATSPGGDTARSSAELISRYLYKIAYDTGRVSLVRHVDLENRLFERTGFDERFVMPFDHVVIGYADEICHMIRGQIDCVFLSSFENSYYTSKRYRLAGGAVVNFLEMRIDFTGSIGAQLCRKLTLFGAANIIFCSHVCAVSEPHTTYAQIYSPSRYIFHNEEGVVRYVVNLPNPLHSRDPRSDTGWHFTSSALPKINTVDTIAHLSAVRSVDSETAMMAAAIEDASHEMGAKVGFCPIHFACDSIDIVEGNSFFCAVDPDKKQYALRHVVLPVKRFLSLL